MLTVSVYLRKFLSLAPPSPVLSSFDIKQFDLIALLAAGLQYIRMVLTKENASIGIIGMGDMGKLYAQRLSAAGWR